MESSALYNDVVVFMQNPAQGSSYTSISDTEVTMLKIWPIFIVGMLGLLLAWMITELVHVEPFKFRAALIVFMGLLGTLAGWKLASREG
jgi:hypothetical protein